MSEERKRIVALKLRFDENSIPALRWALDEVDTVTTRTCMPELPSHANTKAKWSTTVISAENSKAIICPVHRLTLSVLAL